MRISKKAEKPVREISNETTADTPLRNTRRTDIPFEKLNGLLEFAATLSEQKDFDEILRLVVHEAIRYFHARDGIVLLLNPRTRETLKTIYKEGKTITEKPYHHLCNQVCGWVLKKQQPFISTSLTTDKRFQKDLFAKSPCDSVMAVPLQVEGMVFGVLLLMNPHSDKEFSTVDLDLLVKYSLIIAPYLRNLDKLRKFFEVPIPEKVMFEKYRGFGLLGSSEQFLELLKSIEAASGTDVRVLLEGATGTGKELIARAIYRLSARQDKPFVTIDCGAIPEHLIESELFGHVKGAFTGADRDRDGLFVEADGGTLFMDEIASLSLEMQSRLMRVLQEGEVRPVGSNRSRQVDVRIISASSASLEQLMQEKRIRADLYYRLMVYPIYVPSLEERREDIPQLAYHFLQKYATQQHKKVSILDEQILEFLKQRTWPGNIRELEHFVERLVTLSNRDASILGPEVLPIDLKKEMDEVLSIQSSSMKSKSLHLTLAEFEADIIRRVLVKHGWNQSGAARDLGISEGTMRYKMEKFGISKSV